jgi:hypothetical protein
MVVKGRSVMAGVVTAALLLSMVAMSWAEGVEFRLSPKKLNKPGEVLVFMSGLEPEQEIGVRTMMGDVLSDVSYLMKPSAEKADPNGAFAAVWNVDKNTLKVMKPGNYTITVVDESGNTLASAEFMIEKAKKKSKESGE